MKKPRDFELGLWDCKAMRSPEDVESLVKCIAQAGYQPSVGAWTREGDTPRAVPSSELATYVSAAHRLTPAGQRVAEGGAASPTLDGEFWRFPVIRPDQPETYGTLTISRRIGGEWNALIFVGISNFSGSGESLSALCGSWGCFLEKLGDATYTQAKPILGTLTATKDEILRFPGAVARRQLIVGWRTWYGSAYVDAFGRDWLSQLPDETADLGDGGVRHGLKAPPRALAEADPSAFASVWPYLRQANVEPAWPRVAGSRRGAPSLQPIAARREARDKELTEFRRELMELLQPTITLACEQRVKFIDIDWGQLSAPELGAEKRALFVHTIKQAVEGELREHPSARLRLELGSGFPNELRPQLDLLMQANARFTYMVLPSAN